MKLVILSLRKTNLLKPILKELKESGIHHGTVIDSSHMTNMDGKYDEEELGFLNAAATFISPVFGMQNNATVMVAVPDENIQGVLEAIERVTGDLDQSKAGILCVLPVETIKGMP